MATFTLTINTDNAAFGDNLNTVDGMDELDMCLVRVMRKVRDGNTEGNVRDTNGTTVGRFELSED